jgi:uncharacterized protein with HEPN domain
MRRDPRADLWDAQAAVDRILEFTRGRSLDDYLADAMLRSAVECQFEIVGEALSQLAKAEPSIAQRIPRHWRDRRLSQRADTRLRDRRSSHGLAHGRGGPGGP